MDQPSYEVKVPLPPSAKIPPTINPNDFSQIGERFGTYGDAYGSLNTLFSGFAFAILIISLFMQRQELKEQRKELAAQREEISKSNEIAEAQRKITEQQSSLINQQLLDSKIQAFYQLFFKYLEEKNRKLESLQFKDQSTIISQRLLKRFRTSFERHFKEIISNQNQIKNIDLVILYNILEQSIQHANSNTNNQFLESEYFEYICFILRFIEANKTLGITGNAVRTFIAYQSIDEMYCMLLIALNDNELFDYIEKFSLLRKISTYEDELLEAIIFRLYSDSSYSP